MGQIVQLQFEVGFRNITPLYFMTAAVKLHYIGQDVEVNHKALLFPFSP